MMDEIIDGIDELGVLLMGHAEGRLLVRLAALDRGGAAARAAQQRDLAAGDRGGAGRHGLGDRAPARAASSSPTRWISPASSRSAAPYLGDVVGVYGDWTPLADRERLFPEDLDRDDPWQFKNIRVGPTNHRRANGCRGRGRTAPSPSSE